MHWSRICVAGAVLVAGILAWPGCGGDKPAPPKTAGELTEAEKQQIRELNEQRSEEWGGAPKRK